MTTIILVGLAVWALASVPVSILVGRALRDLNGRILVLEGETVLDSQSVEETPFNIHRDFFAPTGADPR